jgi:uncharacterized membrane protein YphA (DoxX/SURF4 family)
MTVSVVARRTLGWLGVAARLVVGTALLWAGGAKIPDLPGSVRAVHAYRILPYEVSEVVGSVLPFIEVTLGLLLVIGLATRLAATVAGLLLAVFIAGIASVWMRGLSIDCGCFGGGGDLAVGQSPQYGGEIARDVVFLALAAVLMWRPATRWSVDSWLLRPDGNELDVDEGDGMAGVSGPAQKEASR